MADAKKSSAKKPARGKPAAPKKPAASKKPAARKKPAPPKKPAAARKPAARKPGPKKPSTAAKPAAKPKARSRAAKKPSRESKATNTAGASAPGADAGTGRQAPPQGAKRFKPQIAAAAEAVKSTISDFIETADVRNFPDKLWRLLAMIAFAFVGNWVFIAAVILAAMQWVVVLLGDKPSSEIAHYMGRCAAYVRQVLDLLSYRSETLPWPLGPLPGEEAAD